MYLFAYDIADTRRRKRVAKRVYAHALGGQRSALELKTRRATLERLVEYCADVIETDSDRIHVFDVLDDPVLMGTAKAVEFDEGMVIV